MKNNNIVITGATGFIGSQLYSFLSENPAYSVSGTSRYCEDERLICTGEFNPNINWKKFLQGADVIIHCAAIAHTKIHKKNIRDVYSINFDETIRVMKVSIKAGVKQFVFLSSILVMGNTTDVPFRLDDGKKPVDDYAKPKALAEDELQKLADASGIALTIIRLPLVYGAGAPGNFASLAKAVKKGWWLPLSNTENLRSMIGINNLIHFIELCILNEKTYNQVFLVSDNQDISTTDLLKKMANVLGKPIKLFDLSKIVLKFLAYSLGKKNIYQGLFGSLQVDISETCDRLGWQPPYTMEQELAQCFQKTVK